MTAVDTDERFVADQHTRTAGTSRVAFWLAVFTVILHLATNLYTPYGIHRDEFLYLAMGRHLHLWSMDFPPAIALIAQFSHTLLGDSLFAIRFMPAIAAGTLVFVSATIARHLGGGRFSQSLAALAVVCCPLFMRAGNLFQPVVFDQLAWTIALYTLVRLVQTDNPKWWIWFGLTAGLGLLTKFSAIFFGSAALIAIIITPERRWFATRWPWLAILLACVIGSPSVVGQIALGYPVLIQMRDLKAAQLDRVTPSGFMLGQLLYGPGVFLAIGGVVTLIVNKKLRRFSVVAWTCVFAFLILMILHGKSYYLGPIYPALFAAGAVALELIPSVVFRRSIQWIAVVLLIAFGAVILPLGLPILPPQKMTAYAHAIGATPALRTNQGQLDRLPQDYADMLGWPEQVAAVAKVYNSLSSADKAQAVIIADNYGEAGAIDYYGPQYGLPRVVSATGTYWFFGPGPKPGNVAVTVGVDAPTLKQFFAESQLIAVVGDPWSVMEERAVPISIARRPFKTLQQVWPSLVGRN